MIEGQRFRSRGETNEEKGLHDSRKIELKNGKGSNKKS